MDGAPAARVAAVVLASAASAARIAAFPFPLEILALRLDLRKFAGGADEPSCAIGEVGCWLVVALFFFSTSALHSSLNLANSDGSSPTISSRTLGFDRGTELCLFVKLAFIINWSDEACGSLCTHFDLTTRTLTPL